MPPEILSILRCALWNVPNRGIRLGGSFGVSKVLKYPVPFAAHFSDVPNRDFSRNQPKGQVTRIGPAVASIHFLSDDASRSMRTPSTITAYLALGANLGDRERNICDAAEQLAATPGIELGKMSRLIETAAQGMDEDSPPFLNAALEIHTSLGAHALLQRMLAIEKSLGRERRDKWASRPIDLDLLLYGNHILSSQELIVPHPLMHERRFVLEPLAEIAPQVVHPTLQMTVGGLLEDLDTTKSRI